MAQYIQLGDIELGITFELSTLWLLALSHNKPGYDNLTKAKELRHKTMELTEGVWVSHEPCSGVTYTVCWPSLSSTCSFYLTTINDECKPYREQH